MDVLMDGLSSELRVGRDQSITVWYFNMIMAQDVKLTQSDDFHLMFDMYRAERRLALVVVVVDNSCSETLDPMLDNADYVPEPTIPDNDVLLLGLQGSPLTPSKNGASYSTSPLKQSAQVVPSTSTIETDPFDIVEEYVGVDDEYMYDVHVDVSATCVDKGGDVQVEKDDGDVFAHHEEEEVADIDPAGYSVVHDPENPDIRVGALFPDIVACRKAIRQRAIIVGFKLAKIKTDTTRFIAQCAHETCKWRIHASVLQDGKTAMINTLPFEHNCPTQKLSNCTMASRGWIADRIGDWVKKNPGVGAEDARAKLEDEYNIKLDYNKTWYGMKVALDQMHGSYEDSFPLLFNWKAELHRAIGSPPGLVISSDACKGLETAINLVFPHCENRECMRHLYANFMKKFHGKVYTDNLYPAARTFSERKFMYHMNLIKEANPSAIEYLDMHHHRLWYRCGFGEASKVDYLTNNISESFNKQIKDFKGLNLNALSKTIGRNKILWTTEHEAEVTLLDVKFVKRHIVNLQNRTCTCRVWQVSGKPCMHALAFICSINGAEIQTYVDDYYSVEKFKAAYAGRIPSMTDKSQWIHVDLGFKVHPPLQKAVAGRPRVQRIRGWLEPGRKVVKCKRCKEPGHMEKTCKVPDPKYVAVDDDIPEDEDVPDPSISTNKRKKDDDAGDAADNEVLINLIRKKARTTPEKPNTATKKKANVKIATTQEKTKNKTPLTKAPAQEKSKKKTPVKKTTSTRKKKKECSICTCATSATIASSTAACIWCKTKPPLLAWWLIQSCL
ncbi:hypothetical protein ACQ4PT_062310 [Festuca glaucescens]